MRVRKTYGKHKGVDVEDSLWNKSDDTFDRLLLNNSNITKKKPSAKDQIRASFNRDSSLDENVSKIQTFKAGKNRKKQKAKKKFDSSQDSSHDVFYKTYLKDKKQMQELKKKERASVRNVQVSTPLQKLGQKQGRKNNLDLRFALSPITLNEDSAQISMEKSFKSLCNDIRQQRLKEIQEADLKLESSVVKRAKEWIEKHRINDSIESVDKVLEKPKSPPKVTQFAIKTLLTKVTTERKLSLIALDDDAKENSVNSLEVSSQDFSSYLTVPDVVSIKTLQTKVSTNHKLSLTAVDDDVKENSMNSLEVPSPDVSSYLTVPDVVLTSPNGDMVFEIDNSSLIEVPCQEEEEVPKHTKEASVEKSSTPDSKVARILTRASKRKLNLNLNVSNLNCDKIEIPTAGEAVVKKLPKKSVAINLVPAVKDISYSYSERDSKLTKTKEKQQRKSNKKSIRFSVGPNNELVSLRPGKWRRSLIYWRRTHVNELNGKEKAILNSSEREADESSVLLEQSDDGTLHAALSILDASIKCATTFHDQRKTSQRKTSVFQRSSIFYGLQEQLIDPDAAPALSARQITLRRCGQQEPLPFNDIYSESELPNCCKIGEGVYGEVFMYKCPTTHQPIVLKIIPIEGDQLINGEPQKRFDEILQEIVISMELSGMRNGKDYATEGFVNVKRVTCVQGAYPEHLIDEWELYRDNRIEGSDNDHPGVFNYDQLYIVFELCNGGKDLEAFVFNNAEEAQSVLLQTALSLAVAERRFEFEHRDLHWGNILIAPTTEKFVEYRVDGKVVKLLTHGVKATIIDYSLSRMVYDGAVLYDNLARDEELFQSNGDYQFDIYRLMRDRVENNFERFEPYTNLLWLHYMVDKLINGARYRYSKTKKHRAAINEMMQERDELLNYTSAFDYISTLELY